jgi:hypothetical protein
MPQAHTRLGISDRSGRAYPLRVMLKEWNGSLVGPDEYESKQPQIEPKRVIGDPQALRNARPDRVEPAVSVLTCVEPFQVFRKRFGRYYRNRSRAWSGVRVTQYGLER